MFIVTGHILTMEKARKLIEGDSSMKISLSKWLSILIFFSENR